MNAPNDAFPDFGGPSAPGADVHGKRRQSETPRFSTTTGLRGLAGAKEAARKLQQVVGEKDAVPFVTPPQISLALKWEFDEGLEEYGLDHGMRPLGLKALGQTADMQQDRAGLDALAQAADTQGLNALSQAAGMQVRQPQTGTGTTKLPDILEEMESPSKGPSDRAGTGPQEVLHGAPPVWPSDAQASFDMHGAGQQANAPSTSVWQSDEDFFASLTNPMANFDGARQAVATSFLGQAGTLEEREGTSGTDFHDDFDFPLRHEGMSQGFGSSTTLADSIASGHGDTTAAAGFPSTSTSYTGPDLESGSAFARTLDYGGSGSIGSGYELPPQSSDSSAYWTSRLNTTAPSSLFPAARIGTQTWDYTGDTSRGTAWTHGVNPVRCPSSNQFFEGLFRQPPTTDVPQIAVQAPSPERISASKKRAPSLSGNNIFGPASKGTRTEDNKTGLPTLPAEAEALWKFHFPGNTHGLLTTLLTWSHTMQSFYNRLPDPKTFPFHSAFPFIVTPPIYNQLVSVGFYDTSVSPHKEVRFLGPGDAKLGYGEVDVFRSKEDLAAFQEYQKQTCKYEAIKQKLGFKEQKEKASRYTDQAHRAATGEGRWAYILIKGHDVPPKTAPHVMLAWHTSAVPNMSTCLHTILPDADKPLPSPPPPSSQPSRLKRLASLQDLMGTNHRRKRVHKVLRSASSSQLPQLDVANILPTEGAQTLRRTVLKFEKAGGVPLVEGYKVDVAKFRPWMDAVGKGQGKLILWREKE
ncbi:hypothetical protein BDW02DRAFT_578181 [Decorospora gaudefroyi]|uniref:Uncharacterized protein n=1 Tax=Decorospora gaudefroyi TaxID=184978 RepID=A0A6A5KP43_9PLEO|nr:hypothetical protein BDW02DRAFT_578181 [Decorospora gaudefroyi]